METVEFLRVRIKTARIFLPFRGVCEWKRMSRNMALFCMKPVLMLAFPRPTLP